MSAVGQTERAGEDCHGGGQRSLGTHGLQDVAHRDRWVRQLVKKIGVKLLGLHENSSVRIPIGDK